MKLLLLSMPDSFEHMPSVAIRMPNGALATLAGNVDAHHRVWTADLILPKAAWHSPGFVACHGWRMLAHTFAGCTLRSAFGLEDQRAVFERFRNQRRLEREQLMLASTDHQETTLIRADARQG